MATIHIDPVTRIEGHLAVDFEIDGASAVVSGSPHLSGVMYRGFENLMKGRPPEDAVQLTQRI